MAKKIKTFVSYDYDKDCNHKELLNAWSKNKNIDFKIKDVSTDVSVNSRDADYIKKRIAKDIKSCDIFLVLIGKDTHKSKWIDEYEIPKAFELNKKIVGILIDQNSKIPDSFKKYSDTLIKTFELKKIIKLIEGIGSEYCKPTGIKLHRIKCSR